MTYYAIKCEPHKDRHVRRALKAQGETVYMAAKCFRNSSRRIKGKRQVENLVRTWLFIRAPDDPELFALWHHRIKHSKNVKQFLSFRDKPVGTHDRNIAALRDRVLEFIRLEARMKAKRKFAVGDKALLKNGSHAGRKGELTYLRGKRVRLEIFIMGQFREVNTTVEQLEAA